MPEMIPNPVQVMLCGVCNQSWKEHERLAERSWWDAQDIDFEGDAPKHFEVTLEQCVELIGTVLKMHFQDRTVVWRLSAYSPMMHLWQATWPD